MKDFTPREKSYCTSSVTPNVAVHVTDTPDPVAVGLAISLVALCGLRAT